MMRAFGSYLYSALQQAAFAEWSTNTVIHAHELNTTIATSKYVTSHYNEILEHCLKTNLNRVAIV